MSLRRNLYVIGLALTASSLFVAVLVERINPRLEATAQLCCLAGVVGVIWLSWYCLRLAGGVTSLIDILNQGRIDKIESTENGAIRKLYEAVHSCLYRQVKRIGELRKQAEELHIRIQLLQKQKRNTEAIIYSIPDAVIVTDGFDKLLMANEPAGELFGFDINRSQLKPITELIDNSEFAGLVRQSRQSKIRHVRHQIELQHHGCLRTLDCIVSCIYDKGEQICGVVVVLHDMTREKEISQMKNEFVSHVSHELKAPLASIGAYAEMLVEGEADDEKTKKEFYSVIQSEAKRLNRLIEDILNISRIESGLVKVNKEPVSLTILIREAMQMIKSQVSEKNIELLRQIPIVFDQVYADRDMILQVIINLLSNAVKYTPAGGSIKVETESNEADGVIRVHVTDTGAGIPEDQLEHVFDRFYRVDANNKYAKGTGLGLHLVQQIVEKVHSGRVFVSSNQGKGSTFSFELPLGAGQALGVAR